MATSILEIIIQAKDEASAKMQSLSDKAKELEPAFQKMAVAGGIAFAGAVAVAGDAVNTFIADQKDMALATNITEQAIMGLSTKAFDKLQKQVGANVDVFESLASTMDEVGKNAVSLGYDDEQASIAFSKLFQITGDVEKAQEQVALAMDLAAFSGKDLEATTKAITLAHTGSTKVLKDFGIEAKEGATVAEVLAAAQEKVGGTAEQMSSTYDVAMKRMSLQIENMKSSVGGAILTALEPLLQKLVPIIEKIVTWAEENPKVVASVIAIVGAVGGLVAIIGILGLAIPSIIAGLAVLTGTFGIVMGIVIALGVTIYNVVNIMDILLNHSNEVLLGIKLYWQDFVKWLKDKVVDPIKQYFTDVWEGIKIIFKESIDGLVEFFNPLFAVLDRVKNAISSAFGAVKGAVTSTVSFFSGGARALGGSVMSNNSYLVGENGPEIFTPSVTGSILPNASIAGGGGITININGGTYLSETVANDIGDMIMNRFKRTYRI